MAFEGNEHIRATVIADIKVTEQKKNLTACDIIMTCVVIYKGFIVYVKQFGAHLK